MSNDTLQEICEYYKKDSSLSQSELVIAVLTELQENRGFLSKEIQDEAARSLNVKSGYIAAVIKSLPHLHDKAFRHELKICISDRCKGKGGTDLLKKVQKLLKVRPGQVTKNGHFLLSTEYCMHNCAHGPNIKIDGVLYQNVTVDTIEDLLKKFR